MAHFKLIIENGMPILEEGWAVFEDDMSTNPPESRIIAIFDNQHSANDECKRRYFEMLDRDHTRLIEGGGSVLNFPNIGSTKYEFNMARVVLRNTVTIADYEEQLNRE